MTMAILALALAACTEPQDGPEDDISTDTFLETTDKDIVRQRDPMRTSDGNQSLVPDRYENGCYVVSQDFNAGAEATVQFANETGFSSSAAPVAFSHYGMLGWGTHTRDDLLAFPLQGPNNSQQGVLVTNEYGDFVRYHDFAFRGLTGPGAVLESDDGQLVTVTNNGDYGSGGVTFDQSSSLVSFNPWLTNSSYYDVMDLETTNAVGLALSGDRAIVASAGAYFSNAPGTGQVSTVDLDQWDVLATKTAPAGLGLNGNLPQEKGYTLLTGFNETNPMAVFDGSQTIPVELPVDCGSGYVVGAQFVQVDDPFLQIIFNDHDFVSQEMSVYSLAGNVTTNEWACERIDSYEAQSAVGVMKYSTDQFCVATDDEIMFYQAE